MVDTKRTYWWLSWFRSRQTHQQKGLILSHEFIAVEQQKTPLVAALVNVQLGDREQTTLVDSHL